MRNTQKAVSDKMRLFPVACALSQPLLRRIGKKKKTGLRAG